MNGLELSERFFHEVMFPLLNDQYPELLESCAFGLVGDGSECFGFDDEISCDHDFSPLCCIWYTQSCDIELIRQFLAHLPKSYLGYPLCLDNPIMVQRRIVSIDAFYLSYTNSTSFPLTNEQYMQIPSHYLAACTNGKVFMDRMGKFSAIRESLSKGYPFSVKLHKMAYLCTKIAQAGQYNYARCLQRGEIVASDLAKAEFMSSVIQLVYLLNDSYAPFYKWMHRGLKSLAHAGTIYDKLDALSLSANVQTIEQICDACYELLCESYHLERKNGFFVEYAYQLQDMIQDETIKRYSIWSD